jgi:hypothetical protein
MSLFSKGEGMEEDSRLRMEKSVEDYSITFKL